MNTNEPVVVEQVFFNASATEAWHAITELEQMKQWFFNNIPEFDPVVGFETKFTVQSEGRGFNTCGNWWRLNHVKRSSTIGVMRSMRVRLL